MKKSKIKNQKLKISDGFTVVELLVAIGLFAVVASIAFGGLARAISAQRQVQALLAANSNAGLAIEIMARSIRTGRWFCVPASPTDPNVQQTYGDCSPQSYAAGSYDTLAFFDSSGKEVAYCLTADGIIRKSDVVSGGASSCDSSSNALTSGNVKIRYLKFTLYGNLTNDGYPPLITISMGVSPNSADPALAGSMINLQTTVSSRQPDG